MTRAQGSLTVLIASAIGSTGVLSQALAAPASGAADVVVAVSAVVLVVSAVLLVRVLRYLSRTPHDRTDHQPPP
ncbi:hypothetical protein [Promicromonospora soli]